MRTLYFQSIQKLEPLYGKQEAKQMVSILLENALGISISRLLMDMPKLSPEQHEKISQQLNRLLCNEPIQYITKEAWFYGRQFKVDSNVLIPRPETEELVAWVLEYSRNTTNEILDIGTGSGCIPISIALECPQNKVSTVDISTEATKVAKANAIQLNANVIFFNEDILLWEKALVLHKKWDIIVSNPPYVRNSEAKQMNNNVLDHEPHLALFVEDSTPLVFYQRIADFAVQFLNANGQLFFEINEAFGRETMEMLQQKGFTDISIKKDIFGKDRITRATLPR